MMARMRKLLRGAGWTFAGLLFFLGIFLLVHDVLVVIHIIAPVGDGPFGLIGGPVFAIIGGIWAGYMKATRSVLR